MVLWLLIVPIYAGVVAYGDHMRRIRAWQRLGPLYHGRDDIDLAGGEGQSADSPPSCVLAVRLVEVAGAPLDSSSRPQRAVRLTDPFLVLKIGREIRVTSRFYGTFSSSGGQRYPMDESPIRFFLPSDRPQTLSLYLYGKKRRRTYREDRLKAVGHLSIVQALANGGEPVSVHLRTRKGVVAGSVRVAVSFDLSFPQLYDGYGVGDTSADPVAESAGEEDVCGKKAAPQSLLVVYAAESLPYIAVPDEPRPHSSQVATSSLS